MHGRLKDKVCIITGSGGSIGLESALAFAREGAMVVGCDISPRADDAVKQVEAIGGQIVSYHPCDLTLREECDKVVQLALDSYGRIDVVFNNAAMAYFGWIEELSFEDFAKTLNEEINIVFHMVQACWQHMVNGGGGSIINMASISARLTFAELPAVGHVAAKGAVQAMTRQLASEGGQHLIRVNSLSPGTIETHQVKPFLADPDWWPHFSRNYILKRIGQPEDVANAALFLASDESSWITGIDLVVDGGVSIR